MKHEQGNKVNARTRALLRARLHALSGSWREIFNSDSRFFVGGDCDNSGLIEAADLAWTGRAYSASMTLPPLAAIILQVDASSGQARDAPR